MSTDLKLKLQSIVSIGECMVELSLNSASNSSCTLAIAGDTLNTAIYLKRAGKADVDVSYCTLVGQDGFSDRVLDLLAQEDLGSTLVGRHPDRTIGLYAIETDADGERRFSYWRSLSAARDLFHKIHGQDFSALSRFDLISYSAISLAILDDECRSLFLDFLMGYRIAGGLVAFDSNYRPQLWSDRNTAQHWIKRAWRCCDIALPSADDEAALFDDISTDDTLHRLRAYGIRLGVLKNGANGPLPLDQSVSLGGFSAASHVVDTTAAGDSFNGAFLASLARGSTLQEAARCGHDMARYVVGQRGAIVPPSSSFER